MVKISKVQSLPNAKKLREKCSKPRFLNVIRLAQFSGAEISEKFQSNSKGTQDILSLFQLQQKLGETIEDFKEVVKKSFSNVKLSGKSLLLDLKEKNITQNVLNQLKDKRLVHKNYLEAAANLISDKTKVPYADKLCSDVPSKQTFMVLHDTLMMSPRLLVHYIKGENTASHHKGVKNLKKIYSSCSIEELFDIKERILDEFCEYTNTDCLIPDGKFSRQKIKRLKKLAEKYDAVDDLLKEHNIHTASIETLFYSGIEKCSKVGDILPNKDIMLGFSNVYDKSLKKDIPVILSFANTDIGYRFKSYRYDEDLILNIEKYKKQVLHYIKTKNYKSINDLNNRIFEYLKTMEVAEVYLEQKDVAGLKKEMERCPDMTVAKIADVLEGSKSDKVYYITNLKNFNNKKYYNVSIPLIKCLKEFGRINNIKEAYTEALAFNNAQHSPVGMYIRNGFKPVSITKEEIEKDLYSRKGFDYKRSVWLVYKM